MESKKKYCGIDVSSSKLDYCYSDDMGKIIQGEVSNTKSGYGKLVKIVGSDRQFIMESTGVYHLGLMFYLYAHNIGYSVINALQIKRYIQMHLERNKSDRKDAKRIYEYGVDRSPSSSDMPDKYYFTCRLLNNSIHDLTKEITRLSNQLHAMKLSPFDTKSVEKSYRSIMKHLREERIKLEVSLQDFLEKWEGDKLKLISSIKGIGKRASAELLILTKGFSQVTNYRQLISYAGLSPVEYSSGSSIRGKSRICKQGGKQLRNILYMCSMTAMKTNRNCRHLYERLVASGKNKKLALIAVANKLLKQVYGVVKNGCVYQDDYVKKLI